MRLVFVTVAWVLGISLVRSPLLFDLSTWLVYFVAALAIAAKYRLHRSRWFIFALAAFAAGAARQSAVPQSSDIAQYNGNTGTITGIIISEPDIRDDRIQLRLRSESIFVNNRTIPTSGQALVETFITADVSYGDRIRATGLLSVPAAGDTFSYADYLGRQGIFTMMSFAGIEVVDNGHGSPVHAALLDLKHTVQDSIAQTLLDLKHTVQDSIAQTLPEPQAGLLTGILLGNERGISPQLAQDFYRVGAIHIVAISGFNMIVISAIVMRVLEGIFRRRRRSAVLGSIFFVVIYAIFVGAGPSIMRAAWMSSLLVIGRHLKRNCYVPASLAFATLALSIADPNVLLDVGFQLSFFAVLGLGLFADPLSRVFRAWLDKRFSAPAANNIHTFLNEPLIVSIVAQISTLPLIILYFGRVSLVALPVNLLIMPIQPLLLIAGLTAAAVFPFLPAIGTVIYWMTMVFLSWTITIVRGFAQLDFADFDLNLDERWIQALYLLMIGGTMVSASRPPFWTWMASLIRRQMVIVTTALTASLILVLMLAMRFSFPDGRLHVWLLDVGHSNAALLQTPNGAHILVDGGRFPSRLLTSIGDRLPFYDRSIEILVITHPDESDIAALQAVLHRYTVGVALLNGQPNETETFLQIKRELADSKTVEVRAGYTIELDDGVFIEVLHPQSQPSITDKLNDQVIVLRVAYGDFALLLTSDLSRRGQRLMLENNIHPLANIMQIPQHGASHALESEFLDLVQPQIALLQSDAANRRRDPDPVTLALFDVPVFRTDEGGVIHLKSDGRQVWVNPSLGQSEEDSASS